MTNIDDPFLVAVHAVAVADAVVFDVIAFAIVNATVHFVFKCRVSCELCI